VLIGHHLGLALFDEHLAGVRSFVDLHGDAWVIRLQPAVTSSGTVRPGITLGCSSPMMRIWSSTKRAVTSSTASLSATRVTKERSIGGCPLISSWPYGWARGISACRPNYVQLFHSRGTLRAGLPHQVVEANDGVENLREAFGGRWVISYCCPVPPW